VSLSITYYNTPVINLRITAPPFSWAAARHIGAQADARRGSAAALTLAAPLGARRSAERAVNSKLKKKTCE